MSADPTPTPGDFLNAHDVCAYLSKNLAIHFQTDCDEMSRDDAVKHFKRREALTIVQTLLVDEAERAAGLKG